MNLSPEKKQIIDQKGNILVTANPGTGKTLLLAAKYISLLQQGMRPEDILCLTFTSKARQEMEERILKGIKESGLAIDTSKINVFTFHSYALDNIEGNELVSSNLLRYAIFRYVKEHEIFNYGDDYLIDKIVPKMENLIRYLKNFGITPDKIDLKLAEGYLTEIKNYSIEDLSRFLHYFIDIYTYYEKIKARSGIDYSDMLLDFLKLRQHHIFKIVLIDELQDVNGIEADIALKSAKQFFAVGDKKQAIFGFQGGSILNFSKFSNSTSFILSENFRSTNEILRYAREHFSSKTKEHEHKVELAGLENKEQKDDGDMPLIYDVEKDKHEQVAALLASQLSSQSQVAIIARTNTQIMAISKELESRGLEHSTTYYSASKEAKSDIITFLKGVLSTDVALIRNAMFTPFFPSALQSVFDIAQKKNKDLSIEEIYTQCPEFKRLRESVRTFEDVRILFRDRIVPVAITYGETYLLAALSVQNACQEARLSLDEKNLENFSLFLDASDLLSNDSQVEKNIIVTSVHKSKGRQYENVIYIPSKPNDSSDFQDAVVKAILQSKGINAAEELEEESLRVDFVGMTRAMKRLFIISDKVSQYTNQYAQTAKIEVGTQETREISEQKKRAYTLFVSGEFEKAKELLTNQDSWIQQFVKTHFENLEHISFSRLTGNASEYLVRNILNTDIASSQLNIGKDVHKLAEQVLKNEPCEVSIELKPYVDNVQILLSQIRQTHPDFVEAEGDFKVPLKQILPTTDSILFKGQIDAVFRNGSNYLIVDWKTSSDNAKAGEHRQQLTLYRKAFALKNNISEDKIKVAIGFIGLKNRINNGAIGYELDMKPPAPSAFETVSKRMRKFLGWKHDVTTFFSDLESEDKFDDSVWRSVVEAWRKEKNVVEAEVAYGN